jgi:gallate decarboxylase subunit D
LTYNITFSLAGMEYLQTRVHRKMEKIITEGRGRTKISFRAFPLGTDLVVHIFNDAAHIGAVALAEYDFKNKRSSVSVLTRLGHKDDAIAQQAAHAICKATQMTTCVAAGVHLDAISQEEISTLVQNAKAAVEKYLRARQDISER